MARTEYELVWAKSTLKEFCCRDSTSKNVKKALEIATDAMTELSVLRKQVEEADTCGGCEGRTSSQRGKPYQCLYCCRNYGDMHDMGYKKGDINYGKSEN